MKPSTIFVAVWCLSGSLCLHGLPTSLSDQSPIIITISQQNTNKPIKIFNHNVPLYANQADDTTPLMQAITMLGETLLEIETQAVATELSNPANLSDDFRSFVRKFFISFLIGISASEVHKKIENITINDSATIDILKSLSDAFLPVVAKAAYACCAYTLLDYGIATGNQGYYPQQMMETYEINDLRRTINVLLSKGTVNINKVNSLGQSALTLLCIYKHKLKTRTCKGIVRKLEKALLDKGAIDPTNNTQ